MSTEIGERRELFVDHFLIEGLTDAQLHLHPPERKNIVLSAQEPHENACSNCRTPTSFKTHEFTSTPNNPQPCNPSAPQSLNFAVSFV